MTQQAVKPIYDYLVIGGGILGMATALEIQRRWPNRSVVVIEKEASVANHQTGRNSGVIHAGVYYQPGSLKARFCKEGNIATKAFCQAHNIPFDNCGKLLVATNPAELERMDALYQRALENGLEVELLDAEGLAEREPAVTGLGAIFVPSTGIVSYRKITEVMAELVVKQGGMICFDTEIERIEEFADRVTVYAKKSRYQGRFMVGCAGLYADRIVRMLGLEPDFQILPFRGEYFLLDERHNQLVNHLIYPIPDPTLPFLGVHLTRMIDGTVTVGPNAVLALKREGYFKTDLSVKDCKEMLGFSGLYRLLKRHFKASLNELKNSISRKGYLALVQKYSPSVQLEDLKPYPAGIRAQAVRPDGTLVDDFLFVNTHRALVVCNAPSPAATSAIPIAAHITDQLHDLMEDEKQRGD